MAFQRLERLKIGVLKNRIHLAQVVGFIHDRVVYSSSMSVVTRSSVLVMI